MEKQHRWSECMWVRERASNKCILMLEKWNCEQTHRPPHTHSCIAVCFHYYYWDFKFSHANPHQKRINATRKTHIEHCFATILLLLFGDGFSLLFRHTCAPHTHIAHLFNIHIIFLNSPRHTAMCDSLSLSVCVRVRFPFLNILLEFYSMELRA